MNLCWRISRLAAAVLLGAVLRASPASAGESMLSGTVWELQQILYNNDSLLQAEPPEHYRIEFMEDGGLNIQADCNAVRGTYIQEGDRGLSITLGPSTRAACPPDSIDRQYLQALSSATLYFFKEGDLYLDLKADVGTMQFSPSRQE